MKTNENKWICDKCGGIIQSSKEAYVEWDNATGIKDFKIVHHVGPNYSKCMSAIQLQNMDLDYFLTPEDGIMNCLLMLNKEGFSKNDVIEIIKRIYIFGYDMVKGHLKNAAKEGVFNPNSEEGFPNRNQTLLVLESLER